MDKQGLDGGDHDLLVPSTSLDCGEFFLIHSPTSCEISYENSQPYPRLVVRGHIAGEPVTGQAGHTGGDLCINLYP